MQYVVWVAVGGGVGSALRYLVALGAGRTLGAAFPYGTLTVNLVGSLVLAFLVTRFAGPPGATGPRLALTTGAMGGFTTYSTFNYELLALIDAGRFGSALVYGGLTVLGALGAGAFGLWLSR